MMRYFVLLAIFTVAISSCKKNNYKTECSEGHIYWGGDPAADGVGWYYASAENSQIPYYIEHLPESFKADGIAVKICLQETNKPIICMCAGSPPNYYQIIDIRKR